MDNGERERWHRVEPFYLQALELAPEERTSFLAGVRASDPALADEITDLLAMSEEGDGLIESLQQPCFEEMDVALSDLDDGPVGDGASAGHEPRIAGAYRLVREIGRGGMGVVYLGERADGEFEQRVAIKLIRRGLDDEESRDRFRRERRILARLEHANIARLYDGGLTPDGVPFYVMEFIDGLPLPEHCDREHLPIAARLALFEAVCRAVQHAHRNLVIHCDLKPGNVLVTPQGDVKLLDFGIARLVQAEPMQVLTRPGGGRPLTPAYASPEQLRGGELTTSTDVYALGLILYELLSGRKAPNAGVEGATIPRPSDVVTKGAQDAAAPDELAVMRGTTLPQLRRALRGELDSIVLLALREEPDQRYGSVDALLDDLRRYREGLPVRAQPPSAAYNLRRFLARHRAGVAVASALVLGLLLAVAGTTMGLVRARRAQWEAERQAMTAGQVTDFMVDLMRAPDPVRNPGVTPSVRDILDRAVDQIPEKLAAQPAVRGKVLSAMGLAYTNIGLQDKGLALAQEGVTDLERSLGPWHPDVGHGLQVLAKVHVQRGEIQETESALSRALAIEERAHGPYTLEAAETDRLLGQVAIGHGDLPLARRYLESGLEAVRRNGKESGTLAAMILIQLGDLSRETGDAKLAVSQLEEARDMLEKAHGGDHEQVAISLMKLGSAYLDAGRAEDAYRCFTRALDMRTRLLGPRHPKVIYSMAAVGHVLIELGRTTEALTLAREAASIQAEVMDPGHIWTAETNLVLAEAEDRTGDTAGAEGHYRKALGVLGKRLGETSPDYLDALLLYGEFCARHVRSADAESCFQKIIRTEDASRGPRARRRTQAKDDLAQLRTASH